MQKNFCAFGPTARVPDRIFAPLDSL